MDRGTGLNRQAVLDGVHGQSAHGGPAGLDGGGGVHAAAQVNPANEVCPVDGDELSVGGGVLVVIGAGQVLQGLLKLCAQRGGGVETETEGRTEEIFSG